METESPKPRRWWSRRRAWGVGIAGALLAIGLTIGLFVVPTMPVTTSGTVTTRAPSEGSCVYCPLVPAPGIVSLPSGALATLEWSSFNVTPVSVKLESWTAGDTPCFWANSTEGTCSFSSTGGYFLFAFFVTVPMPQPPNGTNSFVTYSVTHYHPLL
jgi:hypothetical protein